eukprot:scaffold18779_cov121-Skeletonema_marinoi.AAC.2
MVVLSGAIAVVPGSTRLRGGLKRRVRCWDAAGLIATDLIDGWLGGDEVRVINSGHAVKVVNRRKAFCAPTSASGRFNASLYLLAIIMSTRAPVYLPHSRLLFRGRYAPPSSARQRRRGGMFV